MTSITMPQLGESVAEGTIGKWLKAPGERIERDEPLVEVITDKVTAEIPSPVAGVVERLVIEEGQTVAVGSEIAIIADPSGSASGAPAPTLATAGGPTMDSLSGPPTPPAPRAAAVVSAPPPENDTVPGERRRATPVVRKLAAEHNIDLAQLTGSGAGGRVTRDDVLAYVAQSGAATPLPAASTPLPTPVASVSPEAPAPASAVADEEYLPLTPMRRAIAEHMIRSKQTSPDAWGMVEVDVTSLVRLRESLLNDWQQRAGFELTFLPFFIKAVVESLREHPTMNAAWGEDRIILKRRINVGIAVAVTDGLVVPVIPDADQKSIAGLAHAVRDLALRARSNKLGLADLQGGTFTVNNTGALGSIMSQPIINQPQAGIVTMEAIVKRPVVIENDAIAIRSIMNVCLTFDHRILDGAGALRFLQSVKRRVEAYGPTTAVY
jgi:2-oxoisovalerate dehydrogenase E2 component (dihydrolipoyl transacylase)